ncbi:MAG: hypothetical protein WC124_02760 [Desulfoplanes sp.]
MNPLAVAQKAEQTLSVPRRKKLFRREANEMHRSTIEFIGLWEKLNNPEFKGVEFDSFKSEVGSNAFTSKKMFSNRYLNHLQPEKP